MRLKHKVCISKHAIPVMKANDGGTIVNTASVVAAVGIGDRAAYCASIGAVAALTRAIAIDHVGDAIRCNAIAPGTIDTPYFDEILSKSADPGATRKALAARQLLGRLGTPEEIAAKRAPCSPAPHELCCCRHSIPGPGKGHKAYEDNGARLRLTRCDLFYDGELLCGVGGPQRHYEPATHFELLDQRRRDMLECSCHDHCVERTAFQPTVVAVADLDAHIVIAEVSQQFRSGFGQWWDNLNGTDLSHQPRQYCCLVA
jgi:hypothetical protein